MKICIKAWAWVGIEDRIGIGPGSNHNEGPKLGIGPGSMFRARDRIGIEILGIDPSLVLALWARRIICTLQPADVSASHFLPLYMRYLRNISSTYRQRLNYTSTSGMVKWRTHEFFWKTISFFFAKHILKSYLTWSQRHQSHISFTILMIL